MKRMKKAAALFFALALLTGLLAFPVSGKGKMTAKIKQTDSDPYTYEITFTLTESVSADALGFDFKGALDKGLKAKKAKWLLDDALLSNVDLKGGAGVFAFSEKKSVKGEVFSLTLESEKKPSFGEITFEMVWESGAQKLSLTLKEGDFPVKDAEGGSDGEKTTTTASTSKPTATTKKQEEKPEPSETSEDPVPETVVLTENAPEVTEETEKREEKVPSDSSGKQVLTDGEAEAEKSPLPPVILALLGIAAVAATVVFVKKK